MPSWTDSKDIRQALLQKWDRGYLLVHALDGDDFFPLRIKLKAPAAAQLSTQFTKILNWRERLYQYSKEMLGYGYEIIEHTFQDPLSGKNKLPTHVVIPSLQDAVQLLGKQKELALFLSNAQQLLQRWPVLQDWIRKNPFSLIKMQENCPKIIAVLQWFETHEDRALYMRQLDIEGVDTKFIESNLRILDGMLSMILPEEQIQHTAKHFETRYGLKRKPELVRFRILDERYALQGCTDLTVPLPALQQLHMPWKRVFITENEINFLSFPQVADACLIFGRGYGVNLFGQIPWLKTMEVFYWGDIDTHGFNILSCARAALPQIQSFLMTEEILLAHRSLWVHEEKPVTFSIPNLTTEEYALVCRLQSNQWGQGIRLEQERIRFMYLQEQMDSLLNKK